MTTEWRFGDWFQTISGRKFYPFDPRREDVDLDDIIHALSMLCRFGGHSRCFYSVAQHSVLVSRLCPPSLALIGLFHDAHEAYIGDLIRPIKRTLREGTDVYDVAADRVQSAIEGALRLPGVTKKSDAAHIHEADTLALLAERRDLLNDGPGKWREDGECPDLVMRLAEAQTIVALPLEAAAGVFVARYAELRQ